MKIASFSASNYRSISTAYKLVFSDSTVIVGPNNEGKSNILKALGLSLSIFSNQRRFSRRPIDFSNGADVFEYQWERDFPISLQKENPDGKSVFNLEFSFTEDEKQEFKKITGINLTSNLKVKMEIGTKRDVKVDFLMRGKGKNSLNSKRSEIQEFISQYLLFQYIPAIRTSEMATSIINNLLSRELSSLEVNNKYQKLLEEIEKIQKPVLEKIATDLSRTVSGFIPDLKKVSIKTKENFRRMMSTSGQLFIDDGTETELSFKGDGIISLTAISLINYLSQRGSIGTGMVLMLEEPESHLHPKSIHNLKQVLSEISKKQQVIISTHSPILIDRTSIERNIIVQDGKARPAKEISDIRDTLGIEVSDNLASAFLVLLVEGEVDKVILQSWISSSEKLKGALECKTLVIDHLAGASNLSYMVRIHKSNLCNVFVYVDNDEEGRKRIEECLKKEILKDDEYLVTNCAGLRNTEIEDLINLDSYKEAVKEEFGVMLDIPMFKGNEKWSNRAKKVFEKQGKIWSERTEAKLKELVGKKAAEEGRSSLNPHKSDSIHQLIQKLEAILTK